MSADQEAVVIAFRPRDQVAPRFKSFRSRPLEHPFVASAPMRIDGSVIFSQLLRALHSAGLTFQHDRRTGEFVILPDPQARI